ncbi:MAG: hypothetical protein HY751_10155 [Nitrospinae bacterium]|nr:hypothetical protein [Nitrospinota bacterium]
MKNLAMTAVALLLAACGGASGVSSDTATAESTRLIWAEEGLVLSNTTSTCTLTEGATYRMYYLDRELVSAVSGNGQIFSASQTTGITHQGSSDLLSNPSVIRLGEGRYVMIYNGVSGNISRFHRATSADGVTFTKYTGAFINGAVMEPNAEENSFISVPELVLFNGALHIYYVGNASVNRIFHAVSQDDGVTWERTGQIVLNGVRADDKIVDPEVVITPDGGLKLFFAHSLAGDMGFGIRGIKTAVSNDGVNFTAEEGYALTPSGGFLIDPDVVELIGQPGKYRMYFGKSADGGTGINLYSAVSN